MNASIPQPEPNLTPDEIVYRARAMILVLRERAAETEQLRTLPQQTVQDCIDAGFSRILQPRRFGGYEFGLRTFCDVMKHFSRRLHVDRLRPHADLCTHLPPRRLSRGGSGGNIWRGR